MIFAAVNTAHAQLPARTLGPIDGRRIGYIDANGRDLVEELRAGGESPYMVGRTFHEGFAGVRRVDGSWTWIDTKGRAITSARYHSISDFVDGYAFAHPMDDTTRVVGVDRQGRQADLGVPDGIFLRRSRYAIFREPDAQKRIRRGYVSAGGEKITAPEFAATGAFLNGRGVAKRSSAGPLVMFDAFGKIVADSGLYVKTFPVFADNRLPASATPDGLVGFVDSLGTWAIAPAFSEATGFGEERAAVRRPGKTGWSVIGPDGKDAFPGEFKSAPDFYKGYARVTRLGEDTTLLLDRNGRSPKVSNRYARQVGSDGLVYRSSDKKISYLTLDGKEVINTATLRGRNLATAGEPFLEGFSLVTYRPAASASADDEFGDDGPPANGAGAAGTGPTVTYVWYELRQAMGSIMGNANSAKRFTVYWGTVEAPARTPIGTLTARFPSRPRETMAPTKRLEAVELEPGESLDIEAILIRRNRADFSIVRRGGKDRISDNVRYVMVESSKAP